MSHKLESVKSRKSLEVFGRPKALAQYANGGLEQFCEVFTQFCGTRVISSVKFQVLRTLAAISAECEKASEERLTSTRTYLI
eukprot:1911150-Amphidinium_carterae.1